MDCDRYTRLAPRLKAAGEISVIKYSYTEILEKQGKGGSPPVVIQKSSGSMGREKKSPFEEYAIVERDRVNAEGEPEHTDLEIQCETMQKALHSIFGEHSPIGTGADPIIFRKPYYSLFNCRQEIREIAEASSHTEEQKLHLGWLTDFMDENFQELEIIQSGLVDKGFITFKDLPIIFQTGCIVIGQIQGEESPTVKRERPRKTEQPECFLFHQVSDELEDQKTGLKYRIVNVFRWGFNGWRFGLVAETLYIKEFTGPRKITDLECFPLKQLTDEEINELIPNLIARGKRWCSCVEAKSFQYKGAAEAPKRSNHSWEIKILSKNMSGRVILDHLAFAEAYPELNKPLYKIRGKSDKTAVTIENSLSFTNSWKVSSEITLPRGDLWRYYDKDHPPSDAQALLCPAGSPGYSLDNKDWAYFDVDQLEDVAWAQDPLKDLEVNATDKEMLKDLIMEHFSRLQPDDAVQKKGAGLIFLLYGPPGCGKTLTAELMAEADKRALLRISCGELGQYPFEVERNLESCLKLALRGSAIVLIDEADAFLAERPPGGGARNYFHNAIVSIFLRQLEYFPGVIFLTTNQETEIDQAVGSRVIRLSYDSLNAPSRTKIWKRYLCRGAKDPETSREIESLCQVAGERYELDGREIKTLAQLCLSICRQRNREISMDLIEQMYKMTHKPKKEDPKDITTS